jgi:hypothetical protein
MHKPNGQRSMSITGFLPKLNYLINITLLKTSNPRVSRTLSIPPGVTFYDLHYAIEAAFGWGQADGGPDENHFPTFKVVHGNPHEAANYALMTAALRLELEPDDPDDELRDVASTTFHHILDDFRYREKFITYDYDGIAQYPHVIQVLGKSPDATNTMNFCIGGQGYTTLNAWSVTSDDGLVFKGGPSSWELDLGEVRARVEKCEEDRLIQERTEWGERQKTRIMARLQDYGDAP